MAKEMSFADALSIVLALAMVGREMAELGPNMKEEDLNTALAMVKARLESLRSMGPATPMKGGV